MPHRRRRHVSRATVVLLAPFMRYSVARDAYVLRLVGRRMGPVLVVRRRHTRATA